MPLDMDEVITLGDSDEDDVEIVEETKIINLDPKRKMIKEQLDIPSRKTIGFNVHSEEKAGTKTMKWSV